MRSGIRFAAVLFSVAALSACDENPAPIITEYKPSTTLARVRVLNATNTTFEMSSPAGEWLGVNKNIRHSASRCFEVSPNTAPLVRDSATQTQLAGLPATFEAGKSYALLIYQNAVSPTTNYAFASWQTDGYTFNADSAAIRVFNASPSAGAGGIDVYMNIPNSAAVPPMNATNRVGQAITLSNATNPFIVRGNVSHQVRITRTGSTTTANTLIDATQTAQPGEQVTIVLGVPSTTATTTFRSFSVGGC